MNGMKENALSPIHMTMVPFLCRSEATLQRIFTLCFSYVQPENIHFSHKIKTFQSYTYRFNKRKSQLIEGK